MLVFGFLDSAAGHAGNGCEGSQEGKQKLGTLDVVRHGTGDLLPSSVGFQGRQRLVQRLCPTGSWEMEIVEENQGSSFCSRNTLLSSLPRGLCICYSRTWNALRAPSPPPPVLARLAPHHSDLVSNVASSERHFLVSPALSRAGTLYLVTLRPFLMALASVYRDRTCSSTSKSRCIPCVSL